MRIAILMCGHTRSYDKCRANFFNKIIRPLITVGYTYDLFFSTWNEEGFKAKQWEGKINTPQIIQDSTDISVEENARDVFMELFNNNETSANGASMWYRVYECYKLMEKYSEKYSEKNSIKYDIVIRTRPDLYYDNPLDILWLKSCEKNTVYMAEWHRHFRSVCFTMMDQFAFGTVESMRNYCQTFCSIQKCMRKKYAYTAEGFLHHQLTITNTNVKRIPIHYGIQRIIRTEPMTRYECSACRRGKCNNVEK